MATKGHPFNIKLLAEKTGVEYNKLYRAFNGGYSSLTKGEVEKIESTLNEEVKKYVKIFKLISE